MEATCKTCPFWSGPEDADTTYGDCHHVRSYMETRSPRSWCSEHPLRQRDRLAAMALPAVIAGLPQGEWSLPEGTARDAYAIADAMIAEAAKEKR